MASFSYSDDEDQKRGAQKDKLSAPQAPTGPTPTFAELQRRGMPRPPPAMGAASQALYGAAGAPPPPQAPPSFGDRLHGAGGGAPPSAPQTPKWLAAMGPKKPTQFPGISAPTPPQQLPANYYKPTGQLDQGNLEGYLYDMLANPTATPTYKNAMQQIGSNIDTDASKRGVFYSTIPVGSYSQAGSNLAAGLQGQAYDQLRGYNQDYAQLLMALLGAT